MKRGRSILWVVTTQWRGQAWSGGGDRNASTPELAALAARGTHYNQATTPHPFGPFARAALLTGTPSPENGVKDYYDPLPPAARTIAHDLGEAGYRTAHFGKWHLAKRSRNAPLVGEAHARQIVPPESRGGFEFWEGFESGFRLNDPWLHGSRLPDPVQLPGYQSDVLVNRAGAWIAEQTVPWFAVVSMEAPHPPYDAAVPEGVESPGPDLLLRENVPDSARERTERDLRGYYHHIAATDRAIGRLAEALPEEVIVVVTSVHGDMHGSHGKFRKGWPFEESVRVPFLVVGNPDGVGGEEDQSPVSLLDLPEMSRAWSEGRAWRCERDHAPISMPSVVALPNQGDRVWSGWRSAERKVVNAEDGSPWLEFDLVDDPFERNNLVPQSAQS
ncbi:MAG: sulfatase-like hydrolase/transferase [Opitutaceae bacterium]|jgi:arylsulfatase A-like enzyme|nr:sulfatase-like hydrolase/transferase [Opitutaceae bacterium]